MSHVWRCGHGEEGTRPRDGKIKAARRGPVGRSESGGPSGTSRDVQQRATACNLEQLFAASTLPAPRMCPYHDPRRRSPCPAWAHPRQGPWQRASCQALYRAGIGCSREGRRLAPSIGTQHPHHGLRAWSSRERRCQSADDGSHAQRCGQGPCRAAQSQGNAAQCSSRLLTQRGGNEGRRRGPNVRRAR